MSYMNWSDQLSVGVAEIDAQHKKLVEMINTFYDHMQEDNKTAMRELLISMAKYTMTHFKTEEELFAKYNYPKAQEHKKEHDAFITEVRSVQQRLSQGEHVLTLELTQFVKKWVTDHIMGSDKEYVPFFQARGLK